MKKNGFIATSILYSFFLIFLTLFIGLVANYLHNRVLLAKVEDTSREILNKINNTRLNEINLGDRIKFTVASNAVIINQDSVWTLAKKVEHADDTVTLTFVSDLNAQKPEVIIKRPEDRIRKPHSMSVNLYEIMSQPLNDTFYNNNVPYDQEIIFADGAYNMQIRMVTSSFLTDIRNNVSNEIVKRAILDAGGPYLVYIDNSARGYNNGSYYELRKYIFSQGDQQTSILGNYCGGTFNGSNINYYNSDELGYNTFGYMDLVEESTSNSRKYIDYCYYASALPYNHPAADHVEQYPQSKSNDEIVSKLSNTYRYRLLATVTVNKYSNHTYISGGKGTSIDPYIFTNGGRS